MAHRELWLQLPGGHTAASAGLAHLPHVIAALAGGRHVCPDPRTSTSTATAACCPLRLLQCPSLTSRCADASLGEPSGQCLVGPSWLVQLLHLWGSCQTSIPPAFKQCSAPRLRYPAPVPPSLPLPACRARPAHRPLSGLITTLPPAPSLPTCSLPPATAVQARDAGHRVVCVVGRGETCDSAHVVGSSFPQSSSSQPSTKNHVGCRHSPCSHSHIRCPGRRRKCDEHTSGHQRWHPAARRHGECTQCVVQQHIVGELPVCPLLCCSALLVRM